MSRSPVFVQIFGIQIVIIISCSRHNVNQSVRNADQLISLFHHFLRFGISVIPCAHDDIFRFHRSFTVGMCQGSPYASLFAEAFHITDVTVSKCTEFFYDIFFLIGIFIGTDVYTRAAEHRFFTFQVFFKQGIHESISFRIEQIKMIHTIFLASEFRFVMAESQCMSRSINFRNDFHATCSSIQLEVNKFTFGVITIAGSQTGEGFTFQTESSIRLAPVVTEELLEAVIVQMYLKHIHLIIRHHLHHIAHVSHRNELTSAVHHKSANRIIRPVAHGSMG